MNISNNAGIDSNDLAKRGESLIRKSTNRYLTTVKIALKQQNVGMGNKLKKISIISQNEA